MRHFNISFAGAGRVAGALCKAFYDEGFRIIQVVSPSGKNGKELADRFNASWSSQLTYSDETDVLIVAVPDHLLENVTRQIRCAPGTLIAHTAGSYGLEVYPSHFDSTGILYPLQTFTSGRNISIKGVPVFIEASGDNSLKILKDIAESLGAKVYMSGRENRKLLHLSAVFACNFTNHMLHAGLKIAEKAGFSFDILKPLLEETIAKAMEIGPEQSQTGPAIRKDTNTLLKQMELLSFSPELQKVYQEVSESIITLNESR